MANGEIAVLGVLYITFTFLFWKFFATTVNNILDVKTIELAPRLSTRILEFEIAVLALLWPLMLLLGMIIFVATYVRTYCISLRKKDSDE